MDLSGGWGRLLMLSLLALTWLFILAAALSITSEYIIPAFR